MKTSTVLLCSACAKEDQFTDAQCIGGNIFSLPCQQCRKPARLREYTGYRLCDCCKSVTWDGAGDLFGGQWLCLYCQPEPPAHLRTDN